MDDCTETYYIARVKKPHRKFAVGDIVVGFRWDGTASRLVCSGWSNKLRVFIRGYSMRYQGWNDWMDGHRTTGNGHLTILGKFEISNDTELLYEFSEVKNLGDFIQQLRLFGGNVLEQVEAAATHLS